MSTHTMQDTSHIPPLQPQLLKFELAQPVTGAAYPLLVKVITVALMVGLGVWYWAMLDSGKIALNKDMNLPLFAYGMICISGVYLLTSKTQISAQGIEQNWVWRKRIEMADLAYARLIEIKGFTWLFAPRLYTRTFSGKLNAFYVADPALREQCHRLVKAVDEMQHSVLGIKK